MSHIKELMFALTSESDFDQIKALECAKSIINKIDDEDAAKSAIDYVLEATKDWPDEIFKHTIQAGQQLNRHISLSRIIDIDECRDQDIDDALKYLTGSTIRSISTWGGVRIDRLILRKIKLNLKMDKGSSLIFFDASWGLGELEELLNWEQLASVTSICLRGNALGDEGAKMISESEFLCNIKDIDLADSGITNAGLALILNSKTIDNISSLNVSSNSLDDGCIDIITSSKQAKNLKSLDICNNKVTSHGLSCASQDRHLSNLALFYFDISNSTITGCIDLIQSRSINNSIKSELTCQLTTILNNNADRPSLFDDLHGQELVRLILRMADVGITRHLHDLDLSYRHIDYECIKLLSTSPHLLHVKKMNLSGNSIEYDSIFELSKSGYIENIRHLSLVDTSIGTRGVQILARSSVFSKLTSLDLYWYNLSEDPYEAADIISNSPYLPLSVRRHWSYEAELEAREAESDIDD